MANCDLIFKDDFGYTLRVWVGEDVSDASSITLSITDSYGTTTEVEAQLYEDDHRAITYTVPPGFFAQAGIYVANARVVQGVLQRVGNSFTIEVQA